MVYIDDIFVFLDQFGSPCSKNSTRETKHCTPVPPHPNGKKSKKASPIDILGRTPVRFTRRIDPSSLPLLNYWHGARKKRHSYHASEILNEEMF